MKIMVKGLVYSVLTFLTSCFGMNDVKERPANSAQKPSESFYTLKVNTLQGTALDLAQFKGKKILIVNTASECGYTPQYSQLQELHEKYGDKVVVLGFPCNDFGGQEPGTATDIGSFCKANYGVTFQMMEKVNIKSNPRHPLYQWLSDPAKNGWNSDTPGWNFGKYLINEEGQLLKYFSSGVKPTSQEIVGLL
jgi:glutathione peroxidase